MRKNLVRRVSALFIVLALGASATVLTGCFGPDPTSIRLLKPDATKSVFIDGWDQNAEKGDRALVEQKPSKMWVIPLDAEYRTTKQGEFTVEIVLDPARGYVIKNMNGVQVGRDHDDCLSGGEELYAFPFDANVKLDNFEPNVSKKDDGSDCTLVPEA
jgi:hypothetical protein